MTKMYSGRFAKTVTNVHDCYVQICNMKQCLHNESKKCTLSEIALDADGKCMQIKTDEDKPPKEVEE